MAGQSSKVPDILLSLRRGRVICTSKRWQTNPTASRNPGLHRRFSACDRIKIVEATEPAEGSSIQKIPDIFSLLGNRRKSVAPKLAFVL